MKKLHFDDLPYYQIGSNLHITGILLGGGDESYIVTLPDEEDFVDNSIGYVSLTDEQFKKLVWQLDVQEVELFERGKPTKIIVRKTQRNLDQVIVWQVFARDGFRCRYCGKGDGLQMTYDHIILWKNGGPTTVQNGICACKKCNKKRGDTEYEDWLNSDYYKRVSSNLRQGVYNSNLNVLSFIDEIEPVPRISTRRR